MNNSQTILLKEMGLGPIWKLRQSAPSSEAPAQLERTPTAPEALQSDPKSELVLCPVCGFSQTSAAVAGGKQDARPDYLLVAQSLDAAVHRTVSDHAGAVLLANMLRALGVQQGEKAALVNLVRSGSFDRPAGASLDDADVPSLCLACLKPHVEALQPSMLIALGETAGASLLGRATGSRGQLHEYQGRPMLVTFHPEYLLRRPKEKASAWSDLCLAMRTLARD